MVKNLRFKLLSFCSYYVILVCIISYKYMTINKLAVFENLLAKLFLRNVDIGVCVCVCIFSLWC